MAMALNWELWKSESVKKASLLPSPETCEIAHLAGDPPAACGKIPAACTGTRPFFFAFGEKEM